MSNEDEHETTPMRDELVSNHHLLRPNLLTFQLDLLAVEMLVFEIVTTEYFAHALECQ